MMKDSIFDNKLSKLIFLFSVYNLFLLNVLWIPITFANLPFIMTVYGDDLSYVPFNFKT